MAETSRNASQFDLRKEKIQELLEERLKEAEDPENQGGDLTRSDHIQLFVVGIVVPIALLVGGWLIYG